MRRTAGFTLMELMVVIVIIGILAAIVIPNVVGKADRARQTAARGDLRQIADQVGHFQVDQGRYPASLEDLVTKPSWVDPKKWPAGGYVIKMRQDPWGFDYAYACPSPDGKPFLVQTNGADGASGGEGFDADLTCWD